jgi:hypothetical protein
MLAAAAGLLLSVERLELAALAAAVMLVLVH